MVENPIDMRRSQQDDRDILTVNDTGHNAPRMTQLPGHMGDRLRPQGTDRSRRTPHRHPPQTGSRLRPPTICKHVLGSLAHVARPRDGTSRQENTLSEQREPGTAGHLPFEAS